MNEGRRGFLGGLGATLGLGRARFRRVEGGVAWDASDLATLSGDAAAWRELRAGAYAVARSHAVRLPAGLYAPQRHDIELSEPLECERSKVVLAWAPGIYEERADVL